MLGRAERALPWPAVYAIHRVMAHQDTITACALVIGNEVLSGRTRDANLNWLASRCTEMGIRLAEARVIPDVEDVIVDAINECRAKYTYVFTTGGIGPTHDDITAACIAKAFGVEIERRKEAVELLESFIKKENLNEARLKMAEVPVGAELIYNPVSKAPGFRMQNVYVMAGVPSIMRAMFEGYAPSLLTGKQVLSESVACYLPEGAVARGLSEIQDRYPDVDIGSYPFMRSGNFGCTLVSRGTDADELKQIVSEIKDMIVSLGGEPIDKDLVTPEDEKSPDDY